MRDLKRAVKKRGNKHRRHQLKRDLAESPESAAESEGDVGKYRSDRLNGLDADSTRNKREE